MSSVIYVCCSEPRRAEQTSQAELGSLVCFDTVLTWQEVLDILHEGENSLSMLIRSSF